MDRLLMKDLLEWKGAADRKPLILWGARQVGKTYLMKDFGEKHFSNTVYISFYNNSKMKALFERDYDTRRIINAIAAQENVNIIPDKTLIIFDEVQNAPKVVESLKQFCEDAREYAIICAGSLLGVAIHEGISFPVGKVNELKLFPMTFGEYLMARGQGVMADLIKTPKDPLVSDLSDKFKGFLREYFVIGGMPEAVKSFIREESFEKVRAIQTDILYQYEGDFGKHIKATQLPRVRMVWNSIPIQLAKENKKFLYGKVKEGGRAKEFEIALQWLSDTGLTYKVYNVTKPAIPLKSYVDFRAFKIFMLDVGLLGCFSEIDYASILNGNNMFTEYRGAMTEQYVLQEIIANRKHTLYYYSGSQSTYEVDFLIQRAGGIIPIEVKSNENIKSKSLRFFCDKFEPQIAIRTSMKEYISQGWMENIPLWAIGGI